MRDWIFVTGGAGYIGSHLCAKLKSSDAYAVMLIDKNGKLYPHATRYCDVFADEDFSSPVVKTALIDYKPKLVIHCAEDKLLKNNNLLDMYKNNSIKNIEFMHSCAISGVKNFIYLSNDGVYGTSNIAFTESDKINPSDTFSKNKIISEYALNDYYINYGMNGISFRVTNVLGCDDLYDLGPLPYQTGIQNKVFLSLMKNIPFEIYGNDYETIDGTLIRDYVHVNDVINAIMLAINWISHVNGNYVFNLSSGTGTSINELTSLIEKYVSVNITKSFIGREPGKPPYRVLSNKLLMKTLGWNVQNDIRKMILSTYKWFNSSTCRSLFY